MKTTIRNVEIKSVAAWLPANKISLLSFCGSFPEKQVRDVIRSSGAEYVYRAEEGQKASDLCFNATLSKILCKWKQDSAVSLFLYLDSVFKNKHKLIHNQAPVMNRLCPFLLNLHK